MKNFLICFLMPAGLFIQSAQAQFVTNTNFFIKSGTTVSLDGLVMIPSANLNIVNNGLQKTLQPASGSPVKSISRVYIFTNAVAFSGTIGTYYQVSELNGITENNLQVGYSSSNNATLAGDATSVRDGANHYVSVGIANKNLRVLSLVNGQGALPVTLVSFQAALQEDRVALDWKTIAETNADHFEIERSADGKSWRGIGEVPASGDSKDDMLYHFVDSGPLEGQSYYRLKMVDHDGTFAHSQVRDILRKSDLALVVYPNPFSNEITISHVILPRVKDVQLINSAGKEMAIGAKMSPAGVLSLGSFTPGFYVIKLTLQDGSVKTFKVIKN